MSGLGPAVCRRQAAYRRGWNYRSSARKSPRGCRSTSSSRAAAMVQRLEPHSPVPYLIQRAIELGALQFPELNPGAVTRQPTTIRRHTDVSFPAVVQAGRVYNLRVQVVPAAEVLPSGEMRDRPKPHAHDATLDLLIPPRSKPDEPPPPVRLAISLVAENFEFEGPSRADLLVPEEGTSPALQFGLRGMVVGPGRVMIDFAQDGRPAGSVDLAPVIVAYEAAPAPGTHWRLPQRNWTSNCTRARRRPFPTSCSRSSSTGWPGIRVGSILSSPRAIPPCPIFRCSTATWERSTSGPTSPAGSGNSSVQSGRWWQRPKPPPRTRNGPWPLWASTSLNICCQARYRS